MAMAMASSELQNDGGLPKLAFKEYMEMKREQIQKGLEEAIGSSDPRAPVLDEAIRYSLLAQKKRIYSTVCMASCEAVGGDESVALSMACTFEMLLVMGFLQDDLPCLDNDDLRFGKPATHKVFGEGTTVLACQALLCLVIEQIASNTKHNVSSDNITRAIDEMCIHLRDVSAGQVLDLQSEGKQVSLSEVELIHGLKAGKFMASGTVCAAIMGGATEVEIDKLRNYGKLVGLLFQVCNDVLDVTGSSDKMGKNVGGDALRDNATFAKVLGVEDSKKYARELVAQAYQELSYFDPTKVAPLYHIPHFNISQCH